MAFGDKLRGWFSKVWPAREEQAVSLNHFVPMAPIPPDVVREIEEAMTVQDRRRFMAPDRLHPLTLRGPAVPHSINEDLARDLPRLMAECAWRYATHPIFEGVCNTYTQDIVGPEGPTLQIVSDDNRFNDHIESAWKRVMEMPDPAGRVDGVEGMKLWVRLLLTAGSYLNVFRNIPRGPGAPNFGWSVVHPRRLMTPIKFATDDNVAFGIRFNATSGKPEVYYLDKPTKFGGSEMSLGNYQRLTAEIVQHRYITVEPEQLTGYPMMASALRTVEEIIELDGATMEAAHSAAHHSWWLESADIQKVLHPDPIAGTTYPMQRGVANVAPPGWKANGLVATQPNADATGYRNLRLAEFGRPINMPLLIVMLSVNEATFSSAQFAGSLYRDGVMGIQSFLKRLTLNPLVEQVIIDEVISGRVRRPAKYEKQWTMNVPPYANIEKFVGALEKMVEGGFISKAMASAMLGYDWEKVVASRKRCKEDEEGADLPQGPTEPTPEPVPPAGAAPKKPPAAGPKKPAPPKKRTHIPRRSHAGARA